MILRHKKTKRLYQFISIKPDAINITLTLTLWYRDKKGKIKRKRSEFTYSRLESITEMLAGFEQLNGFKLNEEVFEVYEKEGDNFVV